MEDPKMIDVPQEEKGMPLWTLLVAVAVLAVVGIGTLAGFWYYAHNKKTEPDRQREALQNQQLQGELAQKKAAADAQLAMARNQQEEVLAQARNATNLVGQLLVNASRLSRLASELKVNGDGRLVAQQADLVAQARRFYDTLPTELPAPDMIAAKLEAVRRIERQLVQALGTSYKPEAEMKVTTQNTALWAEQLSARISQWQMRLDSLVSEAKVKSPGGTLAPGAPTLEAAITKLTQEDIAIREKGLQQATDEAKQKADAALADAAAKRLLEEAKLKADKLLADAQKEADQFKRQQELDKAKALMDTATNKAEIEKTELEAKKVLLRQKALDPTVKAKLAPFITPGVWQIKGPATTDPKPLSLTQLQSIGALNPASLQKLVDIGVIHYDKVRPRWKFSVNMHIDRCKPHEIQTAREAQQLLIELGTVLVEMKLLEP